MTTLRRRSKIALWIAALAVACGLVTPRAVGTLLGAGASPAPRETDRPAPAPASAEPPASGGGDTTARPEDPDTFRSTARDRESVTITIYNQDFGLVREVRSVELARGIVGLEFGDVASAIQTETVHIGTPGRAPLRVLEQTYQYDLLSPQKLLEKYVGRVVTIYRWNESEGRDVPVEAEVLAVNGGTILRIGDEITFNYPGRVAFPEVPENLISEPTLVWLLESGSDEHRLEVSYLTNQLNWKSDYVVVVNGDDTEGDLTGWVTLTNQSGAAWEDARLKLVAGDVQRVGDRREMMRAARAVAEAAADQAFAEEGFFEYHLYTLDRPTSVRNNEQKQITLLQADGFGIDKRLIYYGAAHYYRGSYGHVESNAKVGVFLDFENSEDNGLGMPLPAGVIRVYKEDGSGARQFVGEDRIDHTPRDERVRIKLGEAFDVVGDRRQMEYRVLGSCASESAWKVEIRNHKDEAVTVDVMEPVGSDWELVSSSHAARKLDAHTFRFRVEVPARESEEVTYRVRVRWC